MRPTTFARWARRTRWTRWALLALWLLATVPAYAQVEIRTSEAPPATTRTIVRLWDGSNNNTHVCYGPQFLTATKEWTIDGSTLTSIGVSTNTATATTAAAHGMPVGKDGWLVTVSGATVDTDLNGTYIVASTPSTTTFTFTTVGVSDATYTESGLEIDMAALRPPLTEDVVWDVKRQWFNTNQIAEGWAVGTLVSGAFVAGQKFVCDSSAAIVYH